MLLFYLKLPRKNWHVICILEIGKGFFRILFYFYIILYYDSTKWRRFHSGELQSLHCLPNIISVIKSKRLRRAYHVARTKEVRVLSKC